MAKSGENVNELMSQMSAMRRDGPQLIAEWMEKEKKALQKNLVGSNNFSLNINNLKFSSH